jgi:hypothetical protein
MLFLLMRGGGRIARGGCGVYDRFFVSLVVSWVGV